MIIGCYSLDMYCDNNMKSGHPWNRDPDQFTDELGSVCRRQAREAGWKFNWKTGNALCPHCNGVRVITEGPFNP